MDITTFEHKYILETLTLGSARMLTVFSVLPFVSSGSLENSTVRLALASVLSLPVIHLNYDIISHREDGTFLLFLVKEIVLGLLLGFLSAIPFWVLQGLGDLIDNQRGASMADQMDGSLGASASPLAILLNKYYMCLYFYLGGFFSFLLVVYKSYQVWPLFELLPALSINTSIKILHLLDYLMESVILFAAPLVMSMFFVEFGLALINRFAQQLNVFVLAMPLKSITGMAVLYLYLPILAPYLFQQIENQSNLLTAIEGLLK